MRRICWSPAVALLAALTASVGAQATSASLARLHDAHYHLTNCIKVRLGNYVRLLDEARVRVRAWEKAHAS